MIYFNDFIRPTRSVLDSNVNHRGSKLINIMEDLYFILLNGRTRSDEKGLFTFCNSRGKSTIDLIWCNPASLSYINDFEVISDDTGPDHFPIKVSLNILHQLSHTLNHINFFCEIYLEQRKVDRI